MNTLPFDVQRCTGRYDLLTDGDWCPERDTCQRYLAFVQWDRGVVPDYRGIPVNMAVQDCQHKIEVEPVLNAPRPPPPVRAAFPQTDRSSGL